MALNSSGVIKFSDINTELGLAYNTPRKLSDTVVRTLFGVASGRIALSNGYGKSNRVTVNIIIASDTTNYTLNTAAVPGYQAGKTDVILTVDSGIFVYSTDTANAGLSVAAFASGDTVTIVNNGFIIGKGGNGGTLSVGSNGGSAIALSHPTTISSLNGYIAGGGGGGGGTFNNQGLYSGGGGGAGGGAGGNGLYSTTGSGVGGAGGGPRQTGQSKTTTNFENIAGAGGGRIVPGTGGAGSTKFVGGAGGGAGGGGGGAGCGGTGGAGGGGGNVGQRGGIIGTLSSGGGGGGGWGASGGPGGANTGLHYDGGTGGKAINLNGNSVTWTGGFPSLLIFGAVS